DGGGPPPTTDFGRHSPEVRVSIATFVSSHSPSFRRRGSIGRTAGAAGAGCAESATQPTSRPSTAATRAPSTTTARPRNETPAGAHAQASRSPTDIGEVMSTPSITDPTTWALDREIVLVRVLDAERDAVFAACTRRGRVLPMVRPRRLHLTVHEM